ncbi:hypothetical protein [Sphingomonas sp. DC1100-1]|uniref:hypothetical protein n=1 Tax=unclassified Sphingomonas TaxID=196159 RepID=UPI003CEC6012
MSEATQFEGAENYAASGPADRLWFELQWREWPHRVNDDRTTNISFHYGGVQAYRKIHGSDPAMSTDFRSHVEWLDRRQPVPARKGE